MSSSFLEAAEGQFIDEDGKTRALYYENGLVLMTSPLPPLNIPPMYSEESVPIDAALEFVAEHDLDIYYQERSRGGIRGLWVKSKNYKRNGGIYEGYIPVEETEPLEGVKMKPFPSNPPLKSAPSKLRELQEMKKLAMYLEQYTIFEYSRDPEGFGEDSFVIDPDHDYDLSRIGKRLVADNDVIYRGGRIIVPSKDVRRRLLYYLSVQQLNDEVGVENFRTRKVIQDYYSSLSDFRQVKGQLVFTDTSSMLRWRKNQLKLVKRNEVSPYLLPDSIEPYFYRNNNILNGHLTLVQNVKHGELKRALTVAREWYDRKINSGYYTVADPDVEEDHSVFTVDGKVQDGNLTLFRYPDGTYAALLFL